MNRAERRAAMKGHPAGGHLDCGCTDRWLVPMQPVVCPDCKAVSELITPQGVPFPTGDPVGSLKTIAVGCGCGSEYDVLVIVE